MKPFSGYRVYVCLFSVLAYFSLSFILPSSAGSAAASVVSVGVSPTTIVGGKVALGEVFLSEPAPPGGAVVNLSSSSRYATVPRTVTVYERETSATFSIKTKQVTSQRTETISATYGVTVSVSLTITPKAAAMSSVRVDPATVVGGTTAQGTANLTAQAPAGGLVVTLASDNPSVASVPASVTVPEGASSANFPVTTSQVGSSISDTISATYVATASTSVTVVPASTALSSVSLNPTSVVGGTSSQGTANLTGAAPAGGAVVSLTSDSPSVASVPASVTVPAGSTSASFSVATSTVVNTTSAMITGNYGGATSGASLTVQPEPAGVQYFVATNGSDSNPGTQTQPFRTLSRGASVLTPGATLLVRAGTYTASTQLANIPSGTSWSAPVTIKAFPGEQVTLIGETGYQVVYFNNGNHHIVVDGFIIDATGAVNGVKVTYSSAGVGSHHIRIINCEVRNATYSGILTAGKPFGVGYNEFINCRVHDNGSRQSFDHGLYLECDNEIVDGCQIYNNAAYGVHIYEDAPTNITIRNCRVYGHDGAAGILVGSGTGNNVYNNVVYGNSWGISIFYGGGGAVYNNTVCNNGIGIYVCCNAQASTIDNNIVCNNSSVGLYIEDTSVGVMTMRNNMSARNAGGNFRDNSGRAVLSGNLIGDQYDPKFVNAAANDYRLLDGSQAIDTGLVKSELATDCVGIARPRGAGYDIGAYEF